MSEMNTAHKNTFKQFLASTWVSIAILAVSLLFIVESLTLRGDAGKYPLVVGLVTAVLASLDLAGRLFNPQEPGAKEAETPASRLPEKLLIAGWISATLISFYVLGVITTTAISGAIYFRLFVTRNFLYAALAGLAHSVGFWVAFDVLAGFRLYPGIFF